MFGHVGTIWDMFVHVWTRLNTFLYPSIHVPEATVRATERRAWEASQGSSRSLLRDERDGEREIERGREGRER